MRSDDIVKQLSGIIPKYTDAFSETINIISIVPTGTTALVTTASAHGLLDGQNVAILDADAPVEIDTVNSIRVGSQLTIETSQDHDLTLSERDIASGGKTVTLSGANESEFNDTFSLISVINRRKIIVSVDDSGSTTLSGSPLVEDANGELFNGVHEVSNVTATTFEYTLPVSYSLPASGSPVAQVSIRIAAVLDINQYLRDVYTKQDIGDDYLIVQLGDVTRNKNQNEVTDAFDSSIGEYNYTPTFIQTFAIYIIQNMTNLIGGATARDKVESVHIPAIFKAIERAKFDSGFTYSQYKSVCTEHGVFAFDNETSKGKALYVHEIVFQQLATIDKLADTVDSDSNVAMRDISYIMTTDLGTGELLADVDLDEEPIT